MGDVLRKNGTPRQDRANSLIIEDRCNELLRYLIEEKPITAHQVKRWCAQKFGISPKCAWRYVMRVKPMLLERSLRSRDEMIAESGLFYESMIKDKSIRPIDRIKACHFRDRLFGLERPYKVQVEASVTSTQTQLQAVPWTELSAAVAQLADLKTPEMLELPPATVDVESSQTEALPPIGPITDVPDSEVPPSL